MKAKKTKPKPRYFTWAHNVNRALENGSFVRQYPDGVCVQYMNGDNMGLIDAVPEAMTEVDAELWADLVPDCCK